MAITIVVIIDAPIAPPSSAVSFSADHTRCQNASLKTAAQVNDTGKEIKEDHPA